MREKLIPVFKYILGILTVLILYIVVHESGHSLVILACGGRITRFSILNAVVSSQGGNYTYFTSSLLNAAGMLLPVIVSVIHLLLFYKEKGKVGYRRTISIFFPFISSLSVLAWFFVPIAYLAGDTQSNEDVIKFINNSRWNPVLVMILAILLFIGMVILLWKKRVVHGWIDMLKEIRESMNQAE